MNFKRLFSAMFAIAWATACTTTSSASTTVTASDGETTARRIGKLQFGGGETETVEFGIDRSN